MERRKVAQPDFKVKKEGDVVRDGQMTHVTSSKHNPEGSIFGKNWDTEKFVLG